MIVTVEADATPPRVKIETTAATVSRVVDGVSTPVRGLVDGGVIYDYEAPQQTPLTYDDGLTTAVAELPDVGVWLIPPAQPELASQLRIGEFSGWKRNGGQSVSAVPGRAAPVVVSWDRGQREGEITTLALSQDEFDTLSTCLDATGPLYLSFSPSHWPGFGLISWVAIGDVSESPSGSGEPTWEVSLPLTAVDRPAWIAAAGVRIEDLTGTIGALTGTIGALGS